jgi:tetratricopeptide (TPR) repeat protein
MPEQEYARPAPASPAEAPANKPKADSYALGKDLDAVEKKKEGYAPPPAVAAPAGTMGSSSGAYALQPRDDMAGPPLIQNPLEPRPQHFGPRYVPMRKIWERVGRIVTPPTLPGGVTPDAIATAERDAAGAEPTRESMKRLYTLYLLDGRLDRASDVAERWSTKDPLDPDALTARADIAAARGERDVAIRILGSVVDVRPGDQKAVFRLARLHRWSGNPELSCRYSMAAAEIRSTDGKLLTEAVRCTRDLGQSDLASDLMALADDATRRSADTLLTAKPADPSTLSGDLRLEATWDGGDDLDLSLLPPDGARVSWLGAPTRAVISARDVRSTSREGLALRGGAPGEYVVEVTRPAGHRGTVRGSVAVYAAGDRRVVPFELGGTSTRIALLKITTRPKLVPL